MKSVCDGEGWRVDSHWSYNGEASLPSPNEEDPMSLHSRAGVLESSNGITISWVENTGAVIS